MSQVLINFDGKVFKCSTIGTFDDENSLGSLDFKTGEILWNLNKIAQIPRVIKMNDAIIAHCIPVAWVRATKIY